MTKRDIERSIRERKRSTLSVDEQIAIAHALWEAGIGPDHDGLKRTELEDELGLNLEYEAGTSLGHLVDIDLVEEFGSYTLVIAEWMDGGEGKVINGEVEERAREALGNLAADLEPRSGMAGEETAADGSGVTMRSVVASVFDVVPEALEEHLRTTSRPVDALNDAVQAIEDADGLAVGDGYGEIGFTNRAYRYRLTQLAVTRYER